MNSINFRAPLLLALAASLGACENPVKPEGHEDAAGIVIRAGGAELIRVVGTAGAGVATGALTVASGQQTQVLTVSFIDDHGSDVALDDEDTLQVVSTSSATATWQGTAAGSFTGQVAGHSPGTTTLEFQLYHGPLNGGHPEGGAFMVPVTVTAMQP